MDHADELERELRIALMQADIMNKHADTDYKRGLTRYEPWKLVLTAFGTGAIVAGALVAIASRLIGH